MASLNSLVPRPLTTYFGRMNNPVSDLDELNRLKQELATLRQQMDGLSQQVKDIARFFDVQPPDPVHGVAQKVVVRCTDLTLFHRRGKEKEHQIRLAATQSGPYITLNGADEKPRITLSAENNEAQLELFSADWALGVQIKVEEGNRGSVAVFEAGKPRAGIKASDGEGIVTVVHDDGRARVFLRGGAERGEVNIVSSETRAALSLSSTPAGGFIHVNDCLGSRQAAIVATPGGGQLLVYNDLGVERAHLGSAEDSAALKLNWGGTTGVFLAALDTGGTLFLHDAQGNPVIKLPE
jgi:hypothetical protein